MKKKTLSLLITIIILTLSAGSVRAGVAPDRVTIDTLIAWMTGSFSSAEQAAADSDYYDIRLEMVPIWREHSEGIWIYVEQAMASSLDKPYRQRVYFLTQIGDTAFKSEVFTFRTNPLQYAGEYKKEIPFDGLGPEILAEREGCAIYLDYDGKGAFVGSTRDPICHSNLNGARYATSEVRLTVTELYSWDRGFNAVKQQVWGAEKGGYIFKKIKDKK